MALTRATDKIIANADGNLNLSGIVTATTFSGPLVPSGDLNVGNNIKLGAASGIITATSFSGDGSNLTSLPAGLGTALSSTQTSPLNKLYYTNEILSIGATVTVDHPATGTGAYTQYADIRLEEGADLIIEDGDDVIPDILGLGTDGGGLGAGGTGRIRVDSITNKNANGSPTVQNGLIVSGVTTSTTFSGSGASLTNLPSAQLTGALPALDGSNLTGLSGVSVANQSDNRLITATGTTDALNGEANLTFSGSVLNINGTSDDTPLMIDTTNNNGAHLRFRKDGSNQHFVGAGGGFSLGDKEDLSLRGYDNVLFASGNSSTERLRITSQGTLFAKADGTAPVNQAEAGHYSGTGYNAGNALGLMVKRAIHVSDADTKGVGGMFLSHTRNVACNGTAYNMFTLHNREGTFVGDIYVGFSGNSSGACRKYTFACLYNTNNLTSVLFNRRSNNDNLTVNIVSSNTSHFFQVVPTKSGGGTERVVMTIVGAMCGRNDGSGGDFYTVSYN